MIDFETLTLGPLANNVYILSDSDSNESLIIDPSFDIEKKQEILKFNEKLITYILLTHAHFDHIAGVGWIKAKFPSAILVLGALDHELYISHGGARNFGITLPSLPLPDLKGNSGTQIQLGESTISILETPGHTPGHLVYYVADMTSAFVGDLIFAGSVGRSDLPGGNHVRLIQSIRESILTLPPETKLYPGHGDSTTVKLEMESNPFL